MKSQDILILLKLASISLQEKKIVSYQAGAWEDWEIEEVELITQGELRFAYKSALHEADSDAGQTYYESLRSIRSLAESTGVSKSEVSVALHRSYFSGLAIQDRLSGTPRVNISGLTEFIIHGLRYVFPVKPAEIGRGIATTWAAPVLREVLVSGGDTPLIWPDPRGQTKGQVLAPLFKTAPNAVKADPYLYSMLALVDSIRVGMARERKLAADKLVEIMKGAG
ncbi:hypothetical protein V8J88_00930 [Massilia sp. W12]|uniref:hypothetical protein n=1 Tax=Massilia sp. W12 TaxID=3126507 RepID=UPI0030D0643E